MDWKEVVNYLLAADYMEKLYKKERELIGHLEEEVGRTVTPMEAPLGIGFKVANIRAAAVFGTPLVISYRLTGIDYLYTKLAEQIRKLVNYKGR